MLEGMLTDDGLDRVINRGDIFVKEQRIYRWGQWGLSVINGENLHHYPFAWEVAVIQFDHNDGYELNYDTPLTNDVLVFDTDEETNEFILNAKDFFTKLKG